MRGKLSLFLRGALLVLVSLLLSSCKEPEQTEVWRADASLESALTAYRFADNVIDQAKGGLIISSRYVEIPQSSGVTGGVYFTINSEVEEKIAGKTIRVEIEASVLEPSPERRFLAAYSTAAVGNSGWRSFRAHDERARYIFDYEVPDDPAKGTGNDYLGILSNDDGMGAPLIVHAVRILLL